MRVLGIGGEIRRQTPSSRKHPAPGSHDVSGRDTTGMSITNIATVKAFFWGLIIHSSYEDNGAGTGLLRSNPCASSWQDWTILMLVGSSDWFRLPSNFSNNEQTPSNPRGRRCLAAAPTRYLCTGLPHPNGGAATSTPRSRLKQALRGADLTENVRLSQNASPSWRKPSFQLNLLFG